MKLVKGGRYTTTNSDLFIDVLAIYHEDDLTIKVKVRLKNKHNGIVYEERNRRLYKKLISHWKRVG